ncbi:MAG: sulfite exporter TauE/SafE family protein [Litoreibacter sp.]|nr:sulfite exporter TauE/SafE family protein [Litoreibacter sp.]MCY4336107.1 sulfite exporter TauE/SafE family protein [Litoreibacter sp.]
MGLEFSGVEIAAILASYMFAATAKGITGLGFSTTCLPLLALFMGLKDALPLVIIPSICSNLIVMRQVGRFRETVTRFWPMLVALLPGLALGLWLLGQIDSTQAGAALGLILLSWCAFSFATPDLRLPTTWERPLAPLSGCVTGFINGMTGTQVMPVVPFLMMLHLPRNLFIQAINCSFTLSSLVMAFGLGRLGLFSLSDLMVSAFGACFVIFGVRLGGAIRHRMPEALFRRAVLGMLAVIGVSFLLPLLP